jgi:hypothetical protein
MNETRKYFDGGSLLIILITLVLFIIALFHKGFTQELLLEAGVFLVSVKLIIMSYKNSISSEKIHEELAEIRELIKSKS